MATGHFPLPEFHDIQGVELATTSAGIKGDRPDVTLFKLSESTTTAAVFTKNAFCAAPVQLAKRFLASGRPRYLLINTGNANAGTGVQGLKAAESCVRSVAELGNVKEAEVLPFSTGVIGEPLPYESILNVLPAAFDKLSSAHWAEAANAILTTDTRPKGVSSTLALGNKILKLNGICKGSGMINPNMATMLAYVATDLSIGTEVLQDLLLKVNEKSFNSITVDSDTSTNDAVLLMATGESQVIYEELSQDEQSVVLDWLKQAFIELAQLIIRDGEGATKFIEVKVESAKTASEGNAIAYAVAHSPLVKTALFASDPNWGRLLMAIGKVELDDFDIDKVSIFVNSEPLVAKGEKVSSFTEDVGQKLFAYEDITIQIQLNRGEEAVTVWTSDLSHEYVTINAEYRT